MWMTWFLLKNCTVNFLSFSLKIFICNIQSCDIDHFIIHQGTSNSFLNRNIIREQAFAEVGEFERWFQDETLELEDAEDCFKSDLLGCEKEIVSKIRELTLTGNHRR
ncbi:uncharacterized protein VP01_4635g1 [Puccinia sorghi]|uniref:Uncharacterized protein n=1 Tax=Puccinia sorghi TaxID=27349 RepID=A0A0L6UQC1_9BASI|nr:uncharacterized protein VP01_4635g1 [Puccinia sorghi]